MKKKSQASSLLITILTISLLTSVELAHWQSYRQQLLVEEALIKTYQQKLQSVQQQPRRQTGI